MGITCDIFAATAADARDYARADLVQNWVALAAYPHKSFKGLTDLEFGMLWAILDGTDPTDPDYDGGSYDLDHIPTPESAQDTQLCRLPPAFTAYLATMDTRIKAAAAALWAETEELDCQPADLLPVLRDLRQLAQTATTAGKDLYFWSVL